MKLQYTNTTKGKDGKDVTETREITAYTNNYQRSDGIDTLGQEFTFDLVDNPFDFNMMGTRLAIGGKIEFSNQLSNNNKSATTTLNEEPKENIVFQGIIVAEKQSGANKYTYTCFDYCFYLNKSEIEIQFNGVSGLDAIKAVCSENNVPLGNIADIKTKIKKIYQGQPVSDVIKDIIKQATEETGYKYRLEYREGKVHVEDYKELVLDKVITQPINNYSRDLSMEDMRNSILVISSKEKSKSVKSTIQDDESIKKYGLIKKIVKVDDKKSAQTAQIAKKTIQESRVASFIMETMPDYYSSFIEYDQLDQLTSFDLSLPNEKQAEIVTDFIEQADQNQWLEKETIKQFIQDYYSELAKDDLSEEDYQKLQDLCQNYQIDIKSILKGE